MEQLARFVADRLPGPPARVLEVGCGRGDLTLALADAGYDVTGIDPAAPPGPRFRRLKLEDLGAGDGPFDAVVASRSLHHVGNLDLALDRILDLLVPGGVLVLDEFAWDRVDLATAAWYLERLDDPPASLDAFIADWHAEHVGLHGYAAMRASLDAHFEERHFEWTPYLYRTLGRPSAVIDEDERIRRGDIQGTGFRYVGEARQRPPR
jgi:SAM-dependent methyltransferase